MIMKDEGQKTSSTSTTLLGATPNSYDPVVMYSKAGLSKFRKERQHNLYRDHYKMKGNVREKCYKVVVYPSNHPYGVNEKKKIFPNIGGYHNAHHVQVEAEYIPGGEFNDNYYVTNTNAVTTTQGGNTGQIVANVIGLYQ